jgi:hypothetical protein
VVCFEGTGAYGLCPKPSTELLKGHQRSPVMLDELHRSLGCVDGYFQDLNLAIN